MSPLPPDTGDASAPPNAPTPPARSQCGSRRLWGVLAFFLLFISLQIIPPPALATDSTAGSFHPEIVPLAADRSASITTTGIFTKKDDAPPGRKGFLLGA